ncbi:hypothetical protein EVG20_g11428, partial [Dentipellis fragilis]
MELACTWRAWDVLMHVAIAREKLTEATLPQQLAEAEANAADGAGCTSTFAWFIACLYRKYARWFWISYSICVCLNNQVIPIIVPKSWLCRFLRRSGKSGASTQKLPLNHTALITTAVLSSLGQNRHFARCSLLAFFFFASTTKSSPSSYQSPGSADSWVARTQPLNGKYRRVRGSNVDRAMQGPDRYLRPERHGTCGHTPCLNRPSSFTTLSTLSPAFDMASGPCVITPDDTTSADEAGPPPLAQVTRLRLRSQKVASTDSPLAQKAERKGAKRGPPVKAPGSRAKTKPVVEVPRLQAVLRKRKSSVPGPASKADLKSKRLRADSPVEDTDEDIFLLEEENNAVRGSDDVTDQQKLEDARFDDEVPSGHVLDIDDDQDDYLVIDQDETGDLSEADEVPLHEESATGAVKDVASLPKQTLKGKSKQDAQVALPSPSPPLVWEPSSSFNTDSSPSTVGSEEYHKHILDLINKMFDAGHPVPVEEYGRLLVTHQQSQQLRSRHLQEGAPSSSPNLFNATSTPGPSGSSKVTFKPIPHGTSSETSTKGAVPPAPEPK